MPSLRGFSAACALVLAVVLTLAAHAIAATPEQIYGDFALNNGAIAGDYSFGDLKAALAATPEDVFYADFVRAVEDKLDTDYLGRSPGDGGTDLGGATDGGDSTLPTPRTPDESGDPPWPFLALSVLAGALVVTGAGSSIYRRARR